MSKTVKRQLYEAIVANCQELLADPDIENGGRTIVNEMIALTKGRLKSLEG
jgi:hypothetical protein